MAKQNEFMYSLPTPKSSSTLPKPVALTAPKPASAYGLGLSSDPMAGTMRQLSNFVQQQQREQSRGSGITLPSLEEVAAQEGWTVETAPEMYEAFTRRLAMDVAGNRLNNIDTLQRNVHTRYDQDFNAWMNARGGAQPTVQQKPSGTGVGDTLYSALRGGAQVLGESLVGLGQLTTGGNVPISVSQWLDESRAGYESSLSPETQHQRQEVLQTEGFVPTISALIDNPRALATLSAENLAASIGPGALVRAVEGQVARTAVGQAIAQATRPVTSLVPSAVRQAAVGEALVTMGQEGFQRAKDEDLSLSDYLASFGIGATTGLVGAVSGGVAARTGLGNLESVLIPGSSTGARTVRAGVRIPGTAAAESIEEMAQEGAQQIIGNLADGKPATEGLGQAMGLGGTLGAVMGGTVEGARTAVSAVRSEPTLAQSESALPAVNPQTMQGSRTGPTQANTEVQSETESTQAQDSEGLEGVDDPLVRLSEIAAIEDITARDAAVKALSAETQTPVNELQALVAEMRAAAFDAANADSDRIRTEAAVAENVLDEALAELGVEPTEPEGEVIPSPFEDEEITATVTPTVAEAIQEMPPMVPAAQEVAPVNPPVQENQDGLQERGRQETAEAVGGVVTNAETEPQSINQLPAGQAPRAPSLAELLAANQMLPGDINEEAVETVETETQRPEPTTRTSTITPVQGSFTETEPPQLRADTVDTALQSLDFVSEYGTEQQASQAQGIADTFSKTGDEQKLLQAASRLVKQFNLVNRNIVKTPAQNKKSYLDVVASYEQAGTIDTNTANKLRKVAKEMPNLFTNIKLKESNIGNLSAVQLAGVLSRFNEVLYSNSATPQQAVRAMLTPLIRALSTEHKFALFREYLTELNIRRLDESQPRNVQLAYSEIFLKIDDEEENVAEFVPSIDLPLNSDLWNFTSPEAYFLSRIPDFVKTRKPLLEQLKKLGTTLLNIFRPKKSIVPDEDDDSIPTKVNAVGAILIDLLNGGQSQPVKKYTPIAEAVFNSVLEGSTEQRLNALRLSGVLSEEHEKVLLWVNNKYPNVLARTPLIVRRFQDLTPAQIQTNLGARPELHVNSKWSNFVWYSPAEAMDSILHEVVHVAHEYASEDLQRKYNVLYENAYASAVANEGSIDAVRSQFNYLYYGLSTSFEFMADFGSAQLESIFQEETGIVPNNLTTASSNRVRQWNIDTSAVKGFDVFEVLESANANILNASYSNAPYFENSRTFASGDGVRSEALLNVVEVDGVARLNEPSDYTALQEQQINSPEFKAWFGDWSTEQTESTPPVSKVVDDVTGAPLLVYHSGTFDPSAGIAPATRMGAGMHFGTLDAALERRMEVLATKLDMTARVREVGPGQWTWDVLPQTQEQAVLVERSGFKSPELFFDTDKDARMHMYSEALHAASSLPMSDRNPVTAYYLNIRNPKRVIDYNAQTVEQRLAAIEDGHDGFIYENDVEDEGSDSWVAFYPEQIKSADVNSGAFDQNSQFVNRNIVRENQGSAAQQVQAALDSPPTNVDELPVYSDWSALQRWAQRLSTSLVDAYTPVKRWLERMPVSLQLKQKAIDSLYLGQNLGQSLRSDVYENHGGKEAQLRINQVAIKQNLPPESVRQLAGIWMTAHWSTTANQRMLAQLERNADLGQFQRDVHDIVAIKGKRPQQKIDLMRARHKEFVDAQRRLQRFITSINAGTDVQQHEYPLAGGYNTAQVQQVKQMVEAKIPVEYIRHIAAPIYQMNTERLLRDIEGQRVGIDQLRTFLPPQNIRRVETLLPRVIGLAQEASSFDGAAMAKLNQVRGFMRKLIKSDYVPFYGSLAEDEQTAGGRKTINAAPLRLLEGSVYRVPDDGVTTSYQGLESAVKHAHWAPFTQALYEIANSLKDSDVNKFGLSKPKKSSDTDGSQPFANSVKVRDADGQQYSVGIKSNVLARLLAEPIPPYWTMPIINGLSSVTRRMGWLITQVNPAFGPVNMMRDIQERASLITSRSYQRANGQNINSAKLAARVASLAIAKSSSYMKAGYAWGKDKRFTDTPAGQFLKSLDRQGGLSVYAQQFNKTNSINDAEGPFMQFVRGYNDAFNSVAILASYEAMLEAGMTEQRAAAETLDLANFNKVGTTGPALSALYTFSRSAFMGGANFLRAIYDPSTGQLNQKGLAVLAASTLAYAALWSMAADVSDDDEGGNKLLQLSDAATAGNFMIPAGDGFVKVPVAFGLLRLANNMGRSLVQMSRGYKDPSAAIMSAGANGLVPALSPFNAPPSSASDQPLFTMVTALMPTLIEPAMLTAMNKTPFGSELSRPPMKGYTAATDPRANLPETWKWMAETWSEISGFDTSPAAMQQMVEGYLPGLPNELIDAFITNPHREQMGRVVQIPFGNRFYAKYDPSRKRTTLESRTSRDNKLKDEYNRRLGQVNTRYRGIYNLPEAQRKARLMQINDERMKVINDLLLKSAP